MPGESPSRPSMVWDAWGIPSEHAPLPDKIRTLLAQVFGVSGESVTRRDEGNVPLRPSTLSGAHLAGLTTVVGPDQVRTDHRARLLHAGGKSTPDLLRRRLDGPQDAPDAVLFPADHDQVLAVLEYCAEQRIAVVPFGGGTSVVGGVEPTRGGFDAVVALNLRRIDALTDLDPVSGTATLGAGLTGPQAEKLLAEHGLSLGHFPQSFEFASIGGFAATRSSGQASAGYGRFDDMIQRLRVATPSGTLDLGPRSGLGRGTRSARTVLGIGGHARGDHRGHAAGASGPGNRGVPGLVVPGLRHRGRRAARRGAGGGRPDRAAPVRRGRDRPESGPRRAISAANAGNRLPGDHTLEGTAAHVAARCAEAARAVHRRRGMALGEQAARDWEHGRFAAPYLRDALLDVGILCETLETATSWSNLAELKAKITRRTDRFAGGAGHPTAGHVSHFA